MPAAVDGRRALMPATSKLRVYRSKRDFTRTAEPSGDRTIAPLRRRRFVIQKHAATRLHYDFRLELDGVFKSWAVTKGPSLDPKVRRLVVETEDHPLDYGDFEGTIPKGEYGGGTVQLWDRGFWEPDGDRDPKEMLRRGDLKVRLEGARLRGAWHLVRLKDAEGGRTNWLMIKSRDGLERPGEDDALLAQDMSVASGRTMDQIASGAGPKPSPFMLRKAFKSDAVWHSNRGSKENAAAATASLPAPTAPARGAKARSMPEFVEPQLCKLLSKPPLGLDWGHEIKFDGYRMQMRVERGSVVLRTRGGLDWTAKFGAIADAGAALSDGILDGEICALDQNGAPDFPGLQAALSNRRTDDLVFFAFDLLFAKHEDLRGLPLTDRKARLKAHMEAAGGGGPSGVLRYVEHFATPGDAMLASACRMGLEGIVSKRLGGPYRSGRGESWTKSKCRAGQEVVIGGYSTTGGRFHSLLVGANEAGALRYLGHVGTGFGEATLRTLIPALEARRRDDSPFGPKSPKRGRDVHWVEPNLVAEIAFAGWTGDGKLRQASFKGLREDKKPAEVRVEDQPDATSPSAAPLADAGSKVAGVVLSNPDRVLWPASDKQKPVTKQDLARYYEAVGEWMLGHLRGRPCSIVRAPDGIENELFFQRHAAPGTSNLITLVNVFDDREAYLQVDRPEALVALAQISTVEIHPWNCAPGQPEVPGRFVFDLDPAEDVGFDEVVTAAIELKERLERIGLVPFCKTTGGKGLHLTTPFSVKAKDRIGWPEAKAIAQAICAQMAADSPQRYLLNMSKKARKGRIFLDYLRNDRKSTAVAPFSTRAKPGATLSTPLDWPQVRRGLDPKRFTLWTAESYLRKTKPWAEYGLGERPLLAAAKKLIAGA